jgi:hypothetical protein
VSLLRLGVMERRVAIRKRVLKRGTIEFRENALPCKIIDVSDTGAGLAAFNAHVLPEFFMLLMPTGKRVFCRSIWRSAERIGVAFRELRVL